MSRLGRTLLLAGSLALLAGCAPPRQDIDWSGPPVSTRQAYPQYPQSGSRAYPPSRSRSGGYGSDEYERRRIIAEEDRRRAMAERERQGDERKLKSAAQSQMQTSCVQAGIDRSTCRNLAAVGSILIP